MVDVSPSGKPVDTPAKELKKRRLQHEVHALEVSIEKYEIDILESRNIIDILLSRES